MNFELWGTMCMSYPETVNFTASLRSNVVIYGGDLLLVEPQIIVVGEWKMRQYIEVFGDSSCESTVGLVTLELNTGDIEKDCKLRNQED